MNVHSQHRLRANSIERQQVEGWLRDFARRAGLPVAVSHALDLALEEWISNVISYGYEDSAEHWIELRFEGTDHEARVEIEDDGREFNPLAIPPVNTKEPLETRPIGGLGVHVIRSLVDEVNYRRENGCNILTLTKRFAKPA
jgi:anti-sigma regulatory factor (Ser/Thr protein kinase)